MIKKKSLFKNISIFLCLVPMLVLSLFCLVPKKQDFNVSAATVVEDFNFIGSNLIIPVTIRYSTGEVIKTTFIKNTVFFGMRGGIYYTRFAGDILSSLEADSNYDKSFDLGESVRDSEFGSNLELVYDSGRYFRVRVKMNGYITSSIVRVSLSNDSTSSNYNIITYYDSLNNSISFLFESVKGEGAGDLRFSNRTYYLNDINTDDGIYQAGYTDGYSQGVVDGNEQGYNNGYDAGVTEGYSQGVVDGNDQGYNNGYKAGETIGFNNGYTKGVEYGGNYSFMGLIGSVIDAPVSAFTSLLNFELLGVNILGFITGLLTLALIIFIIKLCMGGK